MDRHYPYQLKNKGFKKQCETRGMTLPGSPNPPDLPIAQINPGNPGMQIALVLEKVQMSPGFLCSIICLEMTLNT